ncbi:sensor histidine kinase [Streptomyces sp. 6N223]|uniref:sensor histidine kinase n=1 Tax=Streptomyces sp. 6N223 TaxID=3457412 RepID=UPI003FD41471
MSASGAAVEGRGFALLWWRQRRSVVLDVALALLSAAECGAQAVGFADRTGLPVGPVLVLGIVAGSTLVVRRQWPLAVMMVSIAVVPAQMGWMLALVGFYTLSSTEAPRRVIGALAGMEGLGVIIVTYLVMESDPDLQEQGLPAWFTPLVSALFGIAAVVPPVLLGMYVRARRRLVESLRDRADGLERELVLLADRAEERAHWARGEERRRIAREMHDVVAHRVSLMVVHAAALQAVARKDPEKAARNAALIGDMGRQALMELRTMLGVLRGTTASASAGAGGGGGAAAASSRLAEIAVSASAGGGAGADAGAGGRGGATAEASGVAGVAERAGPEEGEGPCLAEVASLVEQSRAAGMAVELSVEGEPRGYAGPVEATAYRVVQEALTNVHKHAAGAAARVRLAHREGEVAVLVQNEPPPSSPSEGARAARLPSGGNGLVGMRERVLALGGGFVSGPLDGGGFRVSAVIPDRGARG